MINKFIVKIVFLTFFFSSTAFNAYSEASPEQPDYELTHIKHVLSSKPHENNRDIVGVLLYKKLGGRIYVLLGRENIKSKEILSAGKYSELGGFAESDKSYVDNMRTLLEEESLGLIKPSAEYIMDESAFVIKKTETNSKYHPHPTMKILAITPATESYFIPASALNSLRQTQCASLTADEIVKDQFAWLDFEEVLAGVAKKAATITTHDIDGASHKVKFTRQFTEDFLKHPDLKSIVTKLKASSK